MSERFWEAENTPALAPLHDWVSENVERAIRAHFEGLDLYASMEDDGMLVITASSEVSGYMELHTELKPILLALVTSNVRQHMSAEQIAHVQQYLDNLEELVQEGRRMLEERP